VAAHNARMLSALRDWTRAVPHRAAAWIRLGDAWPVAAAMLLAALSGYRAQLVDRVYGAFTGCHGCLNASVAASDASMIAIFLAALALARCGLPYALRCALAIVSVAALLFFAADIIVFRLLAQRLLVADVLHFGGDARRMAGVALPWLAQREGALAGGAMALLAFAAWRAIMRVAPDTRPWPWLLAASAVCTLGAAVPRAEYLHELAYMNVWQVNRQVDPSRAYSEGFQRLHAKAPAPLLDCETGLGGRPSVVVVVVESLSAYHSRLFSGLRDDTPQLDALAREGTYAKTFHANGFSTEGGLIALLTGYVPIPTAGRFGSVMAFTQVKDDFHRWLASIGYRTSFFTTGDLDFGARREWLRGIGIGYAEGADHPFYRGMPRAAFGAASDGALVDRFLAWYDRERGAGPFMATLLTVATHPPFVMPGAGIAGEDDMVREADRQVARLAAQLRDRRFFDDGVMIVVGDHRAMTPIPREERAALGPAAEVRVVGFAIGRTGLPPGEIHGNYQQSDLIPSLRHLIARRACRDEWQGRFLGAQPDPANYVVHADPLRRNELTVIEGPREYRMRLDGDDTRFLDSPPLAQAGALVQRVNAERMARMKEFSAPLRPTR
jgi:lipoteichoic acid synthase